jgi:hypothetical protein
MNQVATIDQATAAPLPAIRKPQDIRVVSDPIAVLDTARFEHMQRIATVMANSNLIPDTLCFEKNEANDKVALPIQTVTANCFLVVNQSVRWNMDPFAVAQCVSVVHGKLCYEGKLIAAVLEGKLGVELEYEISGQGEAMKVIVTGTLNGKPLLDSKGRPKTIQGTVAEWRTSGRGSPWDAKGGFQRMLRYRGAREWARVHSPGMMLGVYGDDEMEDLYANHRAQQARVVNDEPPAPPPPQIAHQPEDPPATPAEELVTAQAPDEQVEWSEVTEQETAIEEPPAPPQVKKSDPISTGKIADDFPGDKPMKPADDGLDIPPALRRTEPKKEAAVTAEWLISLSNALSGCEDTDQLREAQEKYQAPMQGKVPAAEWEQSRKLILEALSRIMGAE